jgi:hypothetical protein
MSKGQVSDGNMTVSISRGFWLGVLYTAGMLALIFLQIGHKWKSLFHFNETGTVAFVSAALVFVVVIWFCKKHRTTVDILRQYPELSVRLSMAALPQLTVVVTTLLLVEALLSSLR